MSRPSGPGCGWSALQPIFQSQKVTGRPVPAASGADPDWVSYTPGLINLTLGNGSLYGDYLATPGELRIKGHLVWGSTTSVSGVVGIQFPTGWQSRAIPGSSLSYDIGRGFYYDGDRYDGPVYVESEVDYALLYYLDANAKAQAVLGTSPVAWGSGDQWWWDVRVAAYQP